MVTLISVSAPPQCLTNKPLIHQSSLPVLLLAALHANLSQGQSQEKANVPADQVEPELVIKGRAGGEVGQVGADGLGEQTEQRLSAESRHGNVGRSKPSA